MDSRMPIWKGHGKNMLSCILLTNSLKSSNSFVTDGSDGRYPKQLVIACYCLHQRKHTPAYARIRQFGTVGSQLQSIPTKHFVIRMQQQYIS